MRQHVHVTLILLALALALPACEQSERERCAKCGMYTDLNPAFVAQLGEQSYDTPKCLWSDLLSKGAEASQASVTEYYAQQPIPAGQAVYVVGSDILGPMGPDLVPLKNQQEAQRFAAEHGGRVVPAQQVDRALLDKL